MSRRLTMRVTTKSPTKCPKCGGRLAVIAGDPRRAWYWRRRECTVCGKRVSSRETLYP